MTDALGNSEFCYPQISMFSEMNIEILWKQISPFPSGPVIKCLIHNVLKGLSYVMGILIFWVKKTQIKTT